MPSPADEAPDSTAVRVALWRALHLEVDAPPPVLVDRVGLELIAPPADWRARQDMQPDRTRLFRASIVARARALEDLVAAAVADGVAQYVILGAGLDTFVQRRPEYAARLQVFEIDAPGPQAWKRRRLLETGYGVPEWLRFIPVNFEAGGDWWAQVAAAGFDRGRPAVVASTGVSMYLTRAANLQTLKQVAQLAPGSTLAMTYLVPLAEAEPEERVGYEFAIKGAQAVGTPFVSFFSAEEMPQLARQAGFKSARRLGAQEYRARYFAGRTDLLYPGAAEQMLIATT